MVIINTMIDTWYMVIILGQTENNRLADLLFQQIYIHAFSRSTTNI